MNRRRGASTDLRARSNPSQGAPARRSVVVVVTVGLLALLVVGAAATGPSVLGEPRVPLPGWVLDAGGPRTAPSAPQDPDPEPEDLVDPDETPWALYAVAVMGAALVALAIRPRRTRRNERDRERDPAPDRPEDDPDVDPTVALCRAADAGREQLDDVGPREVRNAVIASWLALEEAAADGGTPRRPAQTPTEFTAAVLHRYDADATATSELLHLYHRARFGRRELAADAGARALDALAVIAVSLGRAG